MKVENPMTVEQLIVELQKLNPKAEVNINIMQSNRRYGRQLKIESTINRHAQEFWVTGKYGGCCITVWLPDGAYISKFDKNDSTGL